MTQQLSRRAITLKKCRLLSIVVRCRATTHVANVARAGYAARAESWDLLVAGLSKFTSLRMA